MPKLTNMTNVLVINSGPIIIAQAAEFYYTGTTAMRALREERLDVVLVNSNPVTIMTDLHIATVFISNHHRGILETVINVSV